MAVTTTTITMCLQATMPMNPVGINVARGRGQIVPLGSLTSSAHVKMLAVRIPNGATVLRGHVNWYSMDGASSTVDAPGTLSIGDTSSSARYYAATSVCALAMATFNVAGSLPHTYSICSSQTQQYSWIEVNFIKTTHTGTATICFDCVVEYVMNWAGEAKWLKSPEEDNTN